MHSFFNRVRKDQFSIKIKKSSNISWRSLLIRFFCIASIPLSVQAFAQYPDHTLRLIVPFAPGGAVDSVARPAALGLGQALGQTVVVENKAGAGGTIGIQNVARAAPDGYTVLLGNIALASAPALYPRAGVDTKKFAPVILIGTMPYMLLIRPGLQVESLKELMQKAKSNPGKLNYASAGSGSAIHLAGELFKAKAGVDIVHVPYKGAGPAINALLAGDVDMMFSSVAESDAYVKSGKLRALAVTGSARSKDFPQVPTLKESGVPGSEVTGWYGLYVSSETPADVLRTIQEKARIGLRSDAIRQTMENYGLDVSQGDANEAQQMLDSETIRWSQIVEETNIPRN